MSLNNVGWWLQHKHIPSISNLIAQSRSVFKGLYVIVENPFPYGESEWDFDFQNLTAAF